MDKKWVLELEEELEKVVKKLNNVHELNSGNAFAEALIYRSKDIKQHLDNIGKWLDEAVDVAHKSLKV